MAEQVYLVDQNKEQIGVTKLEVALKLAKAVGLDLVEVTPDKAVPICRIMDFGKFKYNRKKKQTNKSKTTNLIKEIKIRTRIEENDYLLKKKHIEKFLEKGYKVKVSLIFRGRELQFKELGVNLLKKLRKDIEDFGLVNEEIKIEGKIGLMLVVPIKKKKNENKNKN